MSEPFYAEIRMFPYNFAPRDWAYCDGQYLSVVQNTALFSLIGTTYGGYSRYGVDYFAIPDLRGRVPLHPRTGPGLSSHMLGQLGGESTVRLQEDNLPTHTHNVRYSMEDAFTNDPSKMCVAKEKDTDIKIWAEDEGTDYIPMASSALKKSGGVDPHENRQPFLVVPFCICLDGLYPPRS